MFWRLLSRNLLRVRSIYWRMVYRGYSATYRLDPTFRFNGSAIEFYGDGAIEVGPDSYIGSLSTVQVCAGHRVRIGRRCRISHNVRIYTQTVPSETDLRISEGIPVQADVEIGDGVWIGANVFIGPGISIGRQFRRRCELRRHTQRAGRRSVGRRSGTSDPAKAAGERPRSWHWLTRP